jgi:hypothetical protein
MRWTVHGEKQLYADPWLDIRVLTSSCLMGGILSIGLIRARQARWQTATSPQEPHSPPWRILGGTITPRCPPRPNGPLPGARRRLVPDLGPAYYSRWD